MDDDPRDDVVRVDRPDPEGELELLVDLLRHRALAVRGGERALRDVRRLVRKREPFVLQDAPDSFAHHVDLRLDLLRMREAFRRLVQRGRIRRHDIEVVGLLVDFVRIDAGRQDERRVHQPAAFVREERAGKVDEAVQEEDHGIFVAVAVPASRRDEVRMGEACVRVRESDDPRQDAAARVRGKRDDEVAEQVLG